MPHHQLPTIVDTPLLWNILWTNLLPNVLPCNTKAYIVNSWRVELFWKHIFVTLELTEMTMLQIEVFRQLKEGQICVINHLQEIKSMTVKSTCYWPVFSKFYHSFKSSNKNILAVQVFLIIFSFPRQYKWTLTGKYFRGDS